MWILQTQSLSEDMLVPRCGEIRAVLKRAIQGGKGYENNEIIMIDSLRVSISLICRRSASDSDMSCRLSVTC